MTVSSTFTAADGDGYELQMGRWSRRLDRVGSRRRFSGGVSFSYDDTRACGERTVNHDLLKTYVVIGADHSAVPIDVTPTLWQELDQRFDGFKGRLLVATFDFEKDWPTWEVHPQGDEIVVLLSGAADMVLEENGSHRVVALSKSGQCVIVPKGTWHTARIVVPTSMLFITPGEGTENKTI
jgi:mannose-6-phosphate isomerase-like protein (cupin superfamily)